MNLPFRLNRASDETLVSQVVNGFKRAIVSNYYRRGDILPSLRELCRGLGVSIRVPKEAIERLAEEGFVIPRQGIGCVVAVPGVKIWRGRILLVLTEKSLSFCFSTYLDSLKETLESSGYLVSRTGLRNNEDGSLDYSYLDTALLRRYDMVFVLDGANRKVTKRIEKTGIPYFANLFYWKEQATGAIGRARIDWQTAAEELKADIEKSNLKSVAQVDYHKPVFEVAKLIKTPYSDGWKLLESISAGSRDAFMQMRRIPELMVFSDDYVANGALNALFSRGMKAPDDFRYVTVYNVGSGIPGTSDPTRIEIDAHEIGARAGAAMLRWLRGETKDEEIILKARYIRGTTF